MQSSQQPPNTTETHSKAKKSEYAGKEVGVIRDVKGNTKVACSVCNQSIWSTNKKRHLNRNPECATATFTFVRSQLCPTEITVSNEVKLSKKRFHGEAASERAYSNFQKAYDDDELLSSSSKKIRHRKRVKCRGCLLSTTHQNFLRHLTLHPECSRKYFNEDGSPRSVLLRIGIGTRWRRNPEYNHEYVLVKRDQLEILEDSFIRLYYKSRGLAETIKKICRAPEPERDLATARAKVNNTEEFSAREAYLRASAILKLYMEDRTRILGHAERLAYFEKVVHSLRKLEMLFDSQYKTYSFPGACDDPACDVLSPECVSVLIDIEHEKELDIAAAYKHETEILNELGIKPESSKKCVSIFDNKIAELQKVLTDLEKEIDGSKTSLNLRPVHSITEADHAVERCKNNCHEIRSRMLKDELKLFDCEMELQRQKGAQNHCTVETTQRQSDLLKIYADKHEVEARIKLLERIAKKRSKVLHTHSSGEQTGEVSNSLLVQAIARIEVLDKFKRVQSEFPLLNAR